jgi:hypothetical protein
MINIYTVVVGEPEWTRKLGRSISKWKNNTKVGLTIAGGRGCGIAVI